MRLSYRIDELQLGDFIAVLRAYLQRREGVEGVYGEGIREKFEIYVFSAGSILNISSALLDGSIWNGVLSATQISISDHR